MREVESAIRRGETFEQFKAPILRGVLTRKRRKRPIR